MEKDERTENQVIKDKLFDDLQDKLNDIDALRGSILRKYGWVERCDFPDSCWRWVKVVKGVTLAIPTISAIRMEQNIIEYTKSKQCTERQDRCG